MPPYAIASLSKLLRPVDGIDVNAKRILAETIGIPGCVDHDGQDCGPTLGRTQAAVLVNALDPGHTKGCWRCPDDAGDLDRNLQPAEIGKGVVGAGIFIQRRRAAPRFVESGPCLF
jgi:hypothetical protein